MKRIKNNIINIIIQARHDSFVYPGSVCIGGTVFSCLVVPPFVLLDKRHHVKTFIANLAVFQQRREHGRLSVVLEAPHASVGNISNLTKLQIESRYMYSYQQTLRACAKPKIWLHDK